MPRPSPARRRRRRLRPVWPRTLYLYLIVEVSRILVLSVLAISLVGSIVLAFQLTRSGIRIGFLWPILRKSLAYPLYFSLPISILAGVTLGLGRMSSELEITAMKANGLSYRQIAAPLLFMALALTGVSVYLNGEVIPRIHYEKGNLREAILGQLEDLGSGKNRHLPLPGQVRLFVTEYRGNQFRGIKLELEDEILSRLEGKLQESLLRPFAGQGRKQSLTLLAQRCDLEISPNRERVFLNLQGVELLAPQTVRNRRAGQDVIRQKFTIRTIRLPLDFLEKGEREKDRSWKELFEQNGELREALARSQTELAVLEREHRMTAVENARKAVGPDAAPSPTEVRKAKTRLLGTRIRSLRDRSQRVETEIHRRAAFSLSCFSFAFVGIPLVLVCDRRSRLVPFFLGNIFVILPFFLLIMLGVLLGERGMYPWLSLALPNGVLMAGGLYLWSRVVRK